MPLRNAILSTLATVCGNRPATRLRAKLRGSPGGRWLLGKVWHLVVRKYESQFQEALLAEVKSGDVVRDVGANVGEYTKLFADAVGAGGSVVAIEPTPGSAQRCRDLIARHGYQNLVVVEVALSDAPGEAFLHIDGLTATTNRLCTDPTDGICVAVTTGDALLEQLGQLPTVIKVDVEGFEVEVLRGMRRVILAAPALRSVFVEVHFGLLESKGVKDGGRQIVDLLTGAGFTTHWLDFSHVMGRR